MKRKILSFAIAFALLTQTLVSAGALTTSLGSATTLPLQPSSGAVSTTVKGEVKGAGESYSTSTTQQTFDYKASIDMSNVLSKFNTFYGIGSDMTTATYTTAYGNSIVTGKFDVTFTFTPGISQLPTATKPLASLNGLSVGPIYKIINVDDTTTPNTVVVTAEVVNPTTGIADLTVSDLNTNQATYLAGFDLDIDNLTASTRNSTITVSMEGYVEIGETDEPGNPYAKIDFKSNPAPVDVYVGSTGGGGGGGKKPGPVAPAPPVLTSDGQKLDAKVEDNGDGTYTVTINSKPEEKDGFIENGWSQTPYAGGDKNYNGVTVIENAVPDENGNFVFHPRYVNVTVPSALEPETDENGNFLHKVYIHGYPDGEVKPNGNITREEVTAAFDRLLNTVYRATIETTEQNFPDVNSDRWSNESIATMANGGFIVGDENGNFNPSKPITRAEFAVIAAKFAPVDAELAQNYFTDIDGHWAKDFILKIAGQYWISGNPDGTFNPDAYITRAEAMTIINRMLVRYGDHESDYATQWPDVEKSDWYYDSVIEATTHNTYVRTENGWSEAWIGDEEVE